MRFWRKMRSNSLASTLWRHKCSHLWVLRTKGRSWLTRSSSFSDRESRSWWRAPLSVSQPTRNASTNYLGRTRSSRKRSNSWRTRSSQMLRRSWSTLRGSRCWRNKSKSSSDWQISVMHLSINLFELTLVTLTRTWSVCLRFLSTCHIWANKEN